MVIDPGFNFIGNLYLAGYSIADIDAIFITHSHEDHVHDLMSLLTLIYERNDYYKKVTEEQIVNPKRKVDLFLSIGAMNAFISRTAPLTKDTVNNIFCLSRTSDIGGEELVIDLTTSPLEKGVSKYKMKIQVMKAEHDEINTTHLSTGIKFIMENGPTIGFTGDTKYHPRNDSHGSLEEHFSDCDILVVHLGDTTFKELVSFADVRLDPEQLGNFFPIGKQIKKTLIN